MSDIPIIKRVTARALKEGLGRPTCFYCHKPLYVKDGQCKNCGAPATPVSEPPSPAEERKVRDEIKHRVKKDSPANFMKSE